MANLAIKGHATRGKEVIELLEMLGGKNPYNYSADCDSLCFYIGKSTNVIYCDWVNNCYNDENILVFTLEEFLKKFPYKIWDKVIDIKTDKIVEIYKAHWSESNNCIYYDVKRPNNTGCVRSHKFLQPFKEQTMINNLEQITLDIPDGYEFFRINDDNKVVLTKKQPQYPKTYEECCKILELTHRGMTIDVPHHYSPKLIYLAQLLICRDAYWKIAGEQMGLEKPWEPVLGENFIYAIGTCYGTIEKRMVTGSGILLFPTEEIRDIFYENFKKTIETVKELL